ncbi:Dor1-like family-domain-containing protein [Delphinella strobiligena]|nr:Dor1-like family-domain-containing protein [Delphinella strobiligena]
MADPLYELLTPYFEQSSSGSHTIPSANDATTTSYLNRISTLSLQSLTSTEPSSLTQSSHAVLRSLQALSKRSHRSVITATDHLSHLSELLPTLNTQSEELYNGLPGLESTATDFAKKYDRNSDNTVLDRRKKAMLLSRNVDRVGDILDLPTLLSTTINSSSTAATQGTGGAAASGYASALDLHAHVKRLRSLYPDSPLITDIAKQSDDEIQNLITVLITGLQNPSLKLAGAMRMIGWLRRIAPDLTSHTSSANQSRSINFGATTGECSLGALFLVCRLNTLRRTLEALEPLKDLADQEAARRKDTKENQQRWMGGAQTERYLKRWIELFREQSFNIVSMYKSIFPSALPMPGSLPNIPSLSDFSSAAEEDSMGRMPSALATFAPHLVDMLADTLRTYLPTISERSSRVSLLTQVLYCAGSLGRQGADFSMMLALLEDELHDDMEAEEDEHDAEWIQVMKKHRIQASRLELLASGVGSGRKGSASAEMKAVAG